MKNLIAISIIFFLLSSCGNSQKELSNFDPIVLKAKESSLYAPKVNWEKVNSEFIKLTKNKKTVDELKEGLQYLINSLGDKHATVRRVDDFSIVVNYTGENEEKESVERKSKYVNDVINNVESQFMYTLLENNIGYLKVVGIGPGNVKEQSDLIRNGLIELKGKNVKKWILDLRFNGGGNMEPMISGLAPLIGEGYIGGAVNNKNEITKRYNIANGQFDNHGRIVCEMENIPKIVASEKVAILLSRYTISSGELVAIAFKGRANTRFIGEKTAGYTTGNGFDKINEELALVISQDVFVDRNDKRYKDNVDVNDEIEFLHTSSLENNQVLKAIDWLNN